MKAQGKAKAATSGFRRRPGAQGRERERERRLITGENCHEMYAGAGEVEDEKCKRGQEQAGTVGVDEIVLNGR